MLIFVQVYRTIDKILCLLKAYVLKEQMRAMESTRIKLYASEEKCSGSQSDPEVMTCHQKQVHHKHLNRSKITRS